MMVNNETTGTQAVIFDLGGVLLREAEYNLYRAHDKNLQELLHGQHPSTRIFNRAFEFVSLFYGQTCKSDWFLGKISGEQIVVCIKENIDKELYDNFFSSEYERMLIKYGMEHIVLPASLIKLTTVIPEGIAFIKKCKNAGITVAVISNWDPASFVLLNMQLPELFSLFDEDNLVIPQLAGVAKPDQRIYAYCINKINHDISDCFFIDDSQANVDGASKYGITAVLHKNWQETECKLKEQGLII